MNMNETYFENLFSFLSVNTAYPPSTDVMSGVPFDTIKEKLRLTHAYVMVEDLPDEQGKNLMLYHYHYQRTKNPIIAIEAILYSNHCGFYPPLWALNGWFLPALQKFFAEKGTGKSLTELLDLKGGTDSFRGLTSETQYRSFMLQIYINRKCFGVPVAKTALALATRLKVGIWDGSGLNMGGMSESRLRGRYYAEKWEDVFDSEQVIKIYTDEEKLLFLDVLSKKDKAKYLKRSMSKPP